MQHSHNKILVTGGAGYIGSHTVVALLDKGCKVVVLDNFCNSNFESIRRIEKITGIRPEVVNADVRDEKALSETFNTHQFNACLLYTSPSPRDLSTSRMPSSA